MAMSKVVLGAAIKSAIDGVGDKTDRAALFEAMADAFITHVIANAVVTVTSVSGVTTGGGTSGPGTGTVSA